MCLVSSDLLQKISGVGDTGRWVVLFLEVCGRIRKLISALLMYALDLRSSVSRMILRMIMQRVNNMFISIGPLLSSVKILDKSPIGIRRSWWFTVSSFSLSAQTRFQISSSDSQSMRESIRCGTLPRLLLNKCWFSVVVSWAIYPSLRKLSVLVTNIAPWEFGMWVYNKSNYKLKNGLLFTFSTRVDMRFGKDGNVVIVEVDDHKFSSIEFCCVCEKL